MLFGSIAETSLEAETLVGLQEKLLFLWVVLQIADAMPATQVQETIAALVKRVAVMVALGKQLNGGKYKGSQN